MSSPRRPGARGAALAAAVLLAAACGDLLDPADGLEFQVSLVIPDTVPLGSELTAVARVEDEAGRIVTGLPLRWGVEPGEHGLPIFTADTAAAYPDLRLRAVRAGATSVAVQLEGEPVRSSPMVSRAVVSVASGVRIAGPPGDEIVLVVDQDTVLDTDLVAVDGSLVRAGGPVEWRVEGDYVTWIVPESFHSVRMRAHRTGQARLIATAMACAGGCEDTMAVRVVQIPGLVQITEPDTIAALGSRHVLAVRIEDTRGNWLRDAVPEWSLADPADSVILTVDGPTVTGVGNGSARVVARMDAVADTVTVHVWQRVWRIVPAQWDVTMTVGDRDTVAVSVEDNLQHPIERPLSFTAASADPSVFTAAPAGGAVELSARAPGEASVVIAAEGVEQGFHVRVFPVVDSLRVRLARDTLTTLGSWTHATTWGWTGTDSVSLLPHYRSGDPGVASVNASGDVRAEGPGSTWIHAELGGHADSARITVRQVLHTLAVEPASAIAAVGGTIPFRAVGRDSARYAIPGIAAAFASSDAGVVQADPTGSALAVSTGRAVVDARVDTFSARAPVRVVPEVVDAAVGTNHVCLLAQGGALYCFGGNGRGQLGDGTRTDRPEPIHAAAPYTFTRVAAGAGFTCGIETGGGTYCWGANDYGTLGRGTTTDGLLPAPVDPDPGFVRIAAMQSHACGLTAAGKAHCWGSNDYGEAGVGHKATVLAPTPVALDLTFRDLATGPWGTCGVTTAGEVYCWGSSAGLLATEPTHLPGAGPFATVSGDGCAITEGNGLHCSDGSAMQPFGGGGSYRAIAGGHRFHCVEAVGGAVSCFGINANGRLGTGDYVDRVLPTPTLLARSARFTITGMAGACSGTPGGGLACWGVVPGWTSRLEPPHTPEPLVYP